MLFVFPSFYFPFFYLASAMFFHLRASTLATSKSLRVDCNVISVIVVSLPPLFLPSSLGAPNGIPIGMGESSRFTMEEEMGVINLGVAWDLVLALL
jgi:hypothetical protein